MRILNLTPTEAALLPSALAAHVQHLMLQRAKARDIGEEVDLAEIDIAIMLRKRLASGKDESVAILMGTPGWQAIAAPVTEAVEDLFGPDVPAALADALAGLHAACATMAALEAKRGLALDELIAAADDLCLGLGGDDFYSLRPLANALVSAVSKADRFATDIPTVGEHFERIIARLDTKGKTDVDHI